MQKPLKPTYFMNEMHDYEFKSFYKKKKKKFKSFSKTFEFNPDLPITRFLHFVSPKLNQ